MCPRISRRRRIDHNHYSLDLLLVPRPDGQLCVIRKTMHWSRISAPLPDVHGGDYPGARFGKLRMIPISALACARQFGIPLRTANPVLPGWKPAARFDRIVRDSYNGPKRVRGSWRSRRGEKLSCC